MKQCIAVLFFLVILFSLPAQEKELLTVMDLNYTGVSASEAEIILDYISAYIVESGKYRVIDKTQRNRILEEQEFSLSGCVDESCQLEIGRMLQASLIITGSIGTLGDRIVLNLKLVNVETAETERTASQRYDSLNELLDSITVEVAKLLDISAGSESNRPAGGGRSDLQDNRQYRILLGLTVPMYLDTRVGAVEFYDISSSYYLDSYDVDLIETVTLIYYLRDNFSISATAGYDLFLNMAFLANAGIVYSINDYLSAEIQAGIINSRHYEQVNDPLLLDGTDYELRRRNLITVTPGVLFSLGSFSIAAELVLTAQQVIGFGANAGFSF